MTAVHGVTTRLAPVLGDRLLTPDAPAFAGAAALALADPRTPAVIARPRTAAEVAAVVRAVAGSGVPFAVRSGGHSYAHLAVAEGGLVLDLRLLDDVRIDPATRAGSAGGE